ncbi:Lar family restriction alleviation protein [Methylobacterium sp. Gmos1]
MELKKCPFCDGVAEVYCRARTYDFVECRVCGASQSMYRYKTAEEAAKAWNTRAAVTADPRVQELEAALEALLEIVEAEFEADPEPEDLTSWEKAILAGRAALAGRAPVPAAAPPQEAV